MLFYCNSCRYIFEEAEGCQQCPDCGQNTNATKRKTEDWTKWNEELFE